MNYRGTYAVTVCMETTPLVHHLNQSSVPDLAVQCSDMWCQVHVQQKVILQETEDSVTSTHINSFEDIRPLHMVL